MSVESQALERSVLESKERDELSAIAEALGLKPGARASKATLVDQILQGIGVEEPKPKPKRTPRKKADDNGNAEGAAAEEGAVDTNEEVAAADPPPATPDAPPINDATTPSTAQAEIP